MTPQLFQFQMTHVIAYSKKPLTHIIAYSKKPLIILVSWTDVNGMVINTSKTQEMVVYFGKQLCVDDIPLICINGRHIKRVVSFKCLV